MKVGQECFYYQERLNHCVIVKTEISSSIVPVYRDSKVSFFNLGICAEYVGIEKGTIKQSERFVLQNIQTKEFYEVLDSRLLFKSRKDFVKSIKA